MPLSGDKQKKHLWAEKPKATKKKTKRDPKTQAGMNIKYCEGGIVDKARSAALKELKRRNNKK